MAERPAGRLGQLGPVVDGPGLLVESMPDRVVIRLNRPRLRNAIDRAMVDALHQACLGLEREPRVAIITGTDGVFAAGADIAELRGRRRVDALAGINSGLFERISGLPMPIIAAVDGYAFGGGAELAYACDFRIATTAARFANPEVGLGILAAAGACWRLRDLVGEPLAKEMLLAGRVLDAGEALSSHLVTQVVDPDELLFAAHALADRIIEGAPLAVRLTKRVFHAPRAAHPAVDEIAQAVLFETEEKADRMTAFLERRPRP
jgi:enoyl-CoA hydratase